MGVRCIFISAHFHLILQPITSCPCFHLLHRASVNHNEIVKYEAHWHTWLLKAESDGLQLQAISVHCLAYYELGLLWLSFKKIKDKRTGTDGAHAADIEVCEMQRNPWCVCITAKTSAWWLEHGDMAPLSAAHFNPQKLFSIFKIELI